MNHATEQGYTALMESAFYGHLEITRYLIEHGADVEYKNNRDTTALHRAAIRGHAETGQVPAGVGADRTVVVLATLH